MDEIKKTDTITDESTNKEDGGSGLEFEIADSALVFDSEADISVSLSDNEDKEPAGKAKAVPETPKHIPEEFTIPEDFEVEDKYKTPSFIEDPKKLRTAYMPRFTEVSETYRMKGDPRPKPEKPKTATKVSTPSSAYSDATSELESDKRIEKVIVTPNPGATSEPVDESITLYKFDSEEVSDVGAIPLAPLKPVDKTEKVEPEKKQDEVVTEEKKDVDSSCIRDAEKKPAEKSETELYDYTYGAFEGMDESEKPVSYLSGSERGGFSMNREFTSPIQKDNFKDKFLDTIMSVRVRLISALAVFLFMLVMEILHLAGVNVYSELGLTYSRAMPALVDFAFCTCLLLFTIPEVVASVALLFKRKCAPELFILVAYAVLGVYTVIVVRSGYEGYPTYGILFAILSLSSVIAGYSKSTVAYRSFRLCTKSATKSVIDKRLTRELPRENLALDGAVDEYRSNTARVFRTAFVSDFFTRINASCENSLNVLIMLGGGLGISLVSSLVCFFLYEGSLTYAANAFTVVFLMSCPAFSILLHKLPLENLSDFAAVEEGAFVGESSVYSAADIDVVAYEDTEIFGVEDVSIKKVHMYGKVYNMPKAMKQMFSLFSVVGGPLYHVFLNSLDRAGEGATDVQLEVDGIAGTLDGTRIFAGTEEYMRRHGIRIPEDDYKSGISSTDSTKIMYGAEGDEVYAKFFIRYSFSEEFTMLLPTLKEERIVPLVYTADPNISSELLKVLTLGEDLIRVMKRNNSIGRKEKVYRRISSGIVTLGDKSSAVNMILLAKKYVAFQNVFATGELAAMIAGAVIAAVFSVSGVLGIPAFALAFLQIACAVFMHLRSSFAFRIKRS